MIDYIVNGLPDFVAVTLYTTLILVRFVYHYLQPPSFPANPSNHTLLL